MIISYISSIYLAIDSYIYLAFIYMYCKDFIFIKYEKI